MVVQAFSIPASEYFEGNDGPWSTFSVLIGTPAQEIRMLPGTSQSSIWAVLNEEVNGTSLTGCPSDAPSDCNALRGIMFDPLNSTTYRAPPPAMDGYALPVVAELSLPGWNVPSDLGTDVVSFNNGPSIPSQYILTYIADNPFLGQFGISARPNHISAFTDTNSSLLASIQGDNFIPSLYYGYTAGAPYRTPQAFGSLVFGGYDANRGNVHSVLTLPFFEPTDRDLSVVLSAITITNSTTQTQVPNLGFYTFIDSLVPEIWLPLASCQAFEAVFGLVWHDVYSMYLMNDAQHQRLMAENATVSFTLAATTSRSANTTIITLPYAAFGLQAAYPLAGLTNDSSIYYFPLKRAANESQYFLGRTLLQEAYLAVDYSRNEFSISPATFPSQQSSTDIITVQLPSGSTGPPGLTGGDIAGIVIGSVAAVLIILGLIFWIRRRRRNTRRRRESQATRTASIGPHSTLVGGPDERAPYDEYFGAKAAFSDDPTASIDPKYKAELDAQSTARGSPGERHELEGESGGRPSPHQTLSWGSGVSSLTERMRGGMGFRDRTSAGATSPPFSAISGHTRGISVEERGEIHEME